MQHHELVEEEDDHKVVDEDQEQNKEEAKSADEDPQKNLDQIMEDLGFGQFQSLAYQGIGLGINSTGFFFYILGFLTQEPALICTLTPDNDSKMNEICTRANVCAEDARITHWEIDQNSSHTLENWRQKLGLDLCRDVYKPSLIASAFFLGWGASLLWLPRMADIYGRRRLFAVGMTIGAIFYTVLMLTESLYTMIITSFVMGLITSIRVNVGSVYLMEMMPKSYQPAVGSVRLIIEGMIYVAATLYFWKVSRSWLYFVAIGYFLQLYSAYKIWELPESPRFLVAQQRLDEARLCLQKIADLNKMPFDWETQGKLLRKKQSDEQSDQSRPKQEIKRSTLEFLRDQKIAINLAVMTIVWLTTVFCHYIIRFQINHFKQVYMTGLMSSLWSLVAHWHGAIWYKSYGIKKSLIICFAVSGLASLATIVYGLDNQTSWVFPWLIVLAEYGLAASFTIIFVAHQYIFPVLFAATALGICNFISRCASAYVSILVMYDPFIPMTVFLVMCSVSIIAVTQLRID